MCLMCSLYIIGIYAGASYVREWETQVFSVPRAINKRLFVLFVFVGEVLALFVFCMNYSSNCGFRVVEDFQLEERRYRVYCKI